MVFKLWKHQKAGFEEARRAFADGRQSVLMVAPCGSGKGSIIAYIMANALRKGTRVLTLAHRRDLLIGPNALEDRLQKQMKVHPKNIGYVISRMKKTYRPLMLGTVQTAVGQKAEYYDLLIVDEAHRIRTNQYIITLKKLLKINPNLKVMGFTATPRRFDGKGLGRIFQKLIQISSHGELVDKQFLVETRIKEPVTPDLKGVRVRAGEYVEKDLELVYSDEVLNSILDKWEEFAHNRKTIFFTINSMKQAHLVAELLRNRGYSAYAITSKTKDKDRARLLAAFDNNEYQVLVNVNIVTEGISIDDADCAVLGYATQSETKYIQSASRVCRALWNHDHTEWRKINGVYQKPDALVIDCGGNRMRFGRLEDYGRIGFDISDEIKLKNPNAQAPQKICPNCFEAVPVQVRICPECGYNFPVQEEDKALATEVEWSDVDPKLAYFEKFYDLNYTQLWNGLKAKKTPEMLLVLMAIRNNRLAWAVYSAADLGYITRLGYKEKKDVKTKQDFNRIVRHLKKKTRDAGYWPIYQKFMGDRLKNGKVIEYGKVVG